MQRAYEPQRADIWSLAIIYFSMTMRRFPWKVPCQTDDFFSLFTKIPNVDESGYDELRQLEDGSLSTHPPDEVRSSSSRNAILWGQIYGPWRLLRMLPAESRQIIGRMLDVDPNRRPTIDQVLQSQWICEIPACQQAENGRVLRADGHGHLLEPGAAVAPDPRSM